MFPVSTHHPSVQRSGNSLVRSPEPCVSAKNPAAVFPLEFGIKHFILLIPRFLAFIGLQMFILPRVLCLFTSLWWVIITLAAIKAEHIQGCVSKSTASRLREVIISLYLAHLRSHLGYRIEFWAPSTRWMPTNWAESNGGLLGWWGGWSIYRERQKDGFVRERRAKVGSNFSLPLSKGCYLEEGATFFSDVHRKGAAIGCSKEPLTR